MSNGAPGGAPSGYGAYGGYGSGYGQYYGNGYYATAPTMTPSAYSAAAAASAYHYQQQAAGYHQVRKMGLKDLDWELSDLQPRLEPSWYRLA